MKRVNPKPIRAALTGLRGSDGLSVVGLVVALGPLGLVDFFSVGLFVTVAFGRLRLGLVAVPEVDAFCLGRDVKNARYGKEQT